MKKVLIVDDEEEIREITKKKLKQNNYEVFTAAGGKEALEISKANKPDLILLDIAMPAMDGYQTCEELKKDKDTKDIPVLFLTAKDLEPESVIQHYTSLGAIGYIAKPATFSELLEKIKEVTG